MELFFQEADNQINQFNKDSNSQAYLQPILKQIFIYSIEKYYRHQKIKQNDNQADINNQIQSQNNLLTEKIQREFIDNYPLKIEDILIRKGWLFNYRFQIYIYNNLLANSFLLLKLIQRLQNIYLNKQINQSNLEEKMQIEKHIENITLKNISDKLYIEIDTKKLFREMCIDQQKQEYILQKKSQNFNISLIRKVKMRIDGFLQTKNQKLIQENWENFQIIIEKKDMTNENQNQNFGIIQLSENQFAIKKFKWASYLQYRVLICNSVRNTQKVIYVNEFNEAIKLRDFFLIRSLQLKINVIQFINNAVNHWKNLHIIKLQQQLFKYEKIIFQNEQKKEQFEIYQQPQQSSNLQYERKNYPFNISFLKSLQIMKQFNKNMIINFISKLLFIAQNLKKNKQICSKFKKFLNGNYKIALVPLELVIHHKQNECIMPIIYIKIIYIQNKDERLNLELTEKINFLDDLKKQVNILQKQLYCRIKKAFDTQSIYQLSFSNAFGKINKNKNGIQLTELGINQFNLSDYHQKNIICEILLEDQISLKQIGKTFINLKEIFNDALEKNILIFPIQTLKHSEQDECYQNNFISFKSVVLSESNQCNIDNRIQQPFTFFTPDKQLQIVIEFLMATEIQKIIPSIKNKFLQNKFSQVQIQINNELNNIFDNLRLKEYVKQQNQEIQWTNFQKEIIEFHNVQVESLIQIFNKNNTQLNIEEINQLNNILCANHEYILQEINQEFNQQNQLFQKNFKNLNLIASKFYKYEKWKYHSDAKQFYNLLQHLCSKGIPYKIKVPIWMEIGQIKKHMYRIEKLLGLYFNKYNLLKLTQWQLNQAKFGLEATDYLKSQFLYQILKEEAKLYNNIAHIQFFDDLNEILKCKYNSYIHGLSSAHQDILISIISTMLFYFQLNIVFSNSSEYNSIMVYQNSLILICIRIIKLFSNNKDSFQLNEYLIFWMFFLLIHQSFFKYYSIEQVDCSLQKNNLQNLIGQQNFLPFLHPQQGFNLKYQLWLLETLLSKWAPNIQSHFIKKGISSQLIFADIFLTMFSIELNDTFLFRLYDIFMFAQKNYCLILSVLLAIHIFQKNESLFLKAKSYQQVYLIIQLYCRFETDIDDVFQNLNILEQNSFGCAYINLNEKKNREIMEEKKYKWNTNGNEQKDKLDEEFIAYNQFIQKNCSFKKFQNQSLMIFKFIHWIQTHLKKDFPHLLFKFNIIDEIYKKQQNNSLEQVESLQKTNQKLQLNIHILIHKLYLNEEKQIFLQIKYANNTLKELTIFPEELTNLNLYIVIPVSDSNCIMNQFQFSSIQFSIFVQEQQDQKVMLKSFNLRLNDFEVNIFYKQIIHIKQSFKTLTKNHIFQEIAEISFIIHDLSLQQSFSQNIYQENQIFHFSSQMYPQKPFQIIYQGLQQILLNCDQLEQDFEKLQNQIVNQDFNLKLKHYSHFRTKDYRSIFSLINFSKFKSISLKILQQNELTIEIEQQLQQIFNIFEKSGTQINFFTFLILMIFLNSNFTDFHQFNSQYFSINQKISTIFSILSQNIQGINKKLIDQEFIKEVIFQLKDYLNFYITYPHNLDYYLNFILETKIHKKRIFDSQQQINAYFISNEKSIDLNEEFRLFHQYWQYLKGHPNLWFNEPFFLQYFSIQLKKKCVITDGGLLIIFSKNGQIIYQCEYYYENFMLRPKQIQFPQQNGDDIIKRILLNNQHLFMIENLKKKFSLKQFQQLFQSLNFITSQIIQYEHVLYSQQMSNSNLFFNPLMLIQIYVLFQIEGKDIIKIKLSREDQEIDDDENNFKDYLEGQNDQNIIGIWIQLSQYLIEENIEQYDQILNFDRSNEKEIAENENQLDNNLIVLKVNNLIEFYSIQNLVEKVKFLLIKYIIKSINNIVNKMLKFTVYSIDEIKKEQQKFIQLSKQLFNSNFLFAKMELKASSSLNNNLLLSKQQCRMNIFQILKDDLHSIPFFQITANTIKNEQKQKYQDLANKNLINYKKIFQYVQPIYQYIQGSNRYIGCQFSQEKANIQIIPYKNFYFNETQIKNLMERKDSLYELKQNELNHLYVVKQIEEKKQNEEDQELKFKINSSNKDQYSQIN